MPAAVKADNSLDIELFGHMQVVHTWFLVTCGPSGPRVVYTTLTAGSCSQEKLFAQYSQFASFKKQDKFQYFMALVQNIF